MGFDADQRAGFLLPALLFLLPFEPRAPLLHVGPVHVTLLELFALLTVVAGWPAVRRWGSFWHGRLPLVLLSAYAGAHILSAVLTDTEPARAFRFALRMVAMAVLAAVVAIWPVKARVRGLLALFAGGVVVSVLAMAEVHGLRGLDPFLAVFREHPFHVGGLRRASAGSEYPNLAGACVAYALVGGAAWAALRSIRPVLVVPFAILLSVGLLETSSRGALLAALLGLLALAVAVRAAPPRRPVLVTLAVLLVSSVVFIARDEVQRLRLANEGVSAWYGAAYAPQETSLHLQPRARRRTGVRVTNLGQRAWTRDGAFHLSHHWYTPQGLSIRDGMRTPLPRDVPPGETVLLDAQLVAPAAPGDYTLLWDMVQEDTSWFSGQGVAPARVAVTVEASPGAPLAAPGIADDGALAGAGWRPGRRELWTLALTLWRERPLTGVGPDNYRWLHASRAGRGTGDTRVYANNLLLEALCTTGLLGAAALLAVLVVSARRAWRAARDASGLDAMVAAALVGLVTVVAAHGMVDYVLAFTGHYVLFGFVVGAVAALPSVTARQVEGCEAA